MGRIGVRYKQMSEYPAVYKPSELKELSGATSTATGGLQQTNKTLKDWNELLKTVDSVLDKFNFSLKTITTRKETLKEQGMTSMQEPIVQPQQIQKQEPPRQVQILIKTKEATADLLDRIKKLDANSTIKDAQELLSTLQESGILESQIEKWIKNYIEVRE